MTAKQKANALKFKKAIAEAKKLRAKNPKLTQPQAVKQAFAILYKTGKVAGTKKANAKSYDKDSKSHNVNIRVVSGVKSKVGYSKERKETHKALTKAIKSQPKELFPYSKKQSIVKAGKKYFDEMSKKLHTIGDVKKRNQIVLEKISLAQEELFDIENDIKIFREELPSLIRSKNKTEIKDTKARLDYALKEKKALMLKIKELKKLI